MRRFFSSDPRIIIAGLLSALAFGALALIIPLQESWSQLYRVPFFELPLRGLMMALLLAPLLPLAYLFSRRDTIDWQRNRHIIWFFTFVFCGIFLLLPLLGSEDVFLYIAQGRLNAVWGHNPYITVPAQVPQDMLYPFIYPVWRSWPAVYGPLWLGIESLLAAILPQFGVAVQVTIFRIFMIGAHLLTGLLLQKCLRKQQVPHHQAYTMLYMWNPLVLFEVVNNAHNEGVIVLLLLASFLLLQNRKYAASVVMLTLSGLIKYSFLLLLPLWFIVIWSRSRRWRDIGTSFSAATIIAILLFLPWWAGAETFRGFLLHSSFVTVLNAPLILDIVAISALLLGAPRENSLTLGQSITNTLFVIYYLFVIYWQQVKRWSLESALVALLAGILLFLTPNTHPWYYLWFLPFLLIQRKLPWFWLLTVLGIMNYLFAGFINAILLVASGGMLFSFLTLRPFSYSKKKS